MGEGNVVASRPPAVERGVPLLATWARWAVSAALFALAFAAALQGALLFLHSERTLADFPRALGIAIAVETVLVFLLLRAEESRLTRELRTARTGTATLRAMVAGRRQQLPFFARLFSAKLGTAAVLLADGDRSGALELLGRGSPLLQGGRLEALRAVVEADAQRAVGGHEALERCADRLRARPRIGNREADLYATHVLVKAVLERGDPEVALELVETLQRSSDEEERLYLAWLCAWFDFDTPEGLSAAASSGGVGAEDLPRERADGEEADRLSRAAAEGGFAPQLSEGEVRLAALLARAHGAAKLVEKLEKRVAAIAHPEPGE
jgi:hypothetical protein